MIKGKASSSPTSYGAFKNPDSAGALPIPSANFIYSLSSMQVHIHICLATRKSEHTSIMTRDMIKDLKTKIKNLFIF